MTRIFEASEIEAAVDPAVLIDAIAKGFVSFSAGDVVVPPVGLLHFDDPPGDVHIKYGYVEGGDIYVVKVASGFYHNPSRGLPTSDGSMLVYRQATGEMLAILLDGGYLTELRTGAAGAVAAQTLAPSNVSRIGVVGAGVQGRFQLRLLREVMACDDVIVWSRTGARLDQYQADMATEGIDVETTTDIREVVSTSDLVITATPTTEPLITAEMLHPGLHITALGSDNVGKQELDALVLAGADIVVADSRSQALHHGECAAAVAAGVIDPASVVELGEILGGTTPGRMSDDQITVADLTGVAVQDVVVAEMACKALMS